MQDGVDELPYPQETQKGGLDRHTLHALQQALPAAHKSNNTHDWDHFNKDVTPIKKNGGASKPRYKLHAEFPLQVEESIPQALA